MLGERSFGRGDRDEFDFGELMLADHAACVFASRARLGAEARRAGGDTEGEFFFVEDFFAHEIGEGDFGGRNEPKSFTRFNIKKNFPNLDFVSPVIRLQKLFATFIAKLMCLGLYSLMPNWFSDFA